MFLKETLRMRPPVCSVGAAGRTVVADRVVLGGYVIPKGVTVSASIAALHYDETYGLPLSACRQLKFTLYTNPISVFQPVVGSLHLQA
jgi:hypothetical protein